MQIRAPFNVAPTPAYQPGLIYHNNAWKTPNQLVVESNVETENRPVEEKFPVSAGLDHQKTENNMDVQSADVFARFQVGLYVCAACDQVKSECTRISKWSLPKLKRGKKEGPKSILFVVQVKTRTLLQTISSFLSRFLSHRVHKPSDLPRATTRFWDVFWANRFLTSWFIDIDNRADRLHGDGGCHLHWVINFILSKTSYPQPHKNSHI